LSKLDPLLRYYTTIPAASEVAGHLPAVFDAAEPPPAEADAEAGRVQNVLLEVTEDTPAVRQALEDAGFKKRTAAGLIFSGEMARDALSTLETIPEVKRAESARVLHNQLDVAVRDSRVDLVHAAHPARRGAGVIVAIIDHGVDYRHGSFRNADGSSRILAIWDQGLNAEAGEHRPDRFDYGVEYTQGDIDAALGESDPLAKVRCSERLFHGTQVAGVAAGNGRPADPPASPVRFVGVAPEADLVVVANTRKNRFNPGTLGDSADVLDAIDYILRIAQDRGRPVVINQSQGDNIGPHDGTGLLEKGIANLMAAPGRAFVAAAGNGFDKHWHASGAVTLQAPADVLIDVDPNAVQLMVDFWYPKGHRIDVSVIPPDGVAPVQRFSAPFSGRVSLANGNAAFVDLELNDPGNGDNRIFIVVDAGTNDVVSNGPWTFRLEGEANWHAWLQIASPASFREPFRDGGHTVTVPGTSQAVISVGSYVTQSALSVRGTRSAFSACGPTRDGREAPTLCAPGEKLMTANDGGAPPIFFEAHGTSVSAPMVAGAVALLFEIDKTLTAGEIRACLTTTARRDQHTGVTPNHEWGAGKLDAKAACDQIAPG
jgi:subtilisin family serine protease